MVKWSPGRDVPTIGLSKHNTIGVHTDPMGEISHYMTEMEGYSITRGLLKNHRNNAG